MYDVVVMYLSSTLTFSQLNEESDSDDLHHIVRLLDHFIHKNHLCLAFEVVCHT